MTIEAEAPPAPAKPARKLLADGIYLGLPMADYVADPALSGGGFFKLLTEAGLITWESAANPLWEEDSTIGQLRGSASHSAILEGLDAYEAGYCIAPSGVLKSGDDMSAWLKRAKESGREDMAALKVSGKVGELRARVEEARKLLAEDDALWPTFYDEKVGGRAVLSGQDDAYVRLLTRFVRGCRDAGPHLIEGLPEVTIVLTLEGVRFKCRIDYMTAGCDLDLKTYGRGPNLDNSLKRHLVRQLYYQGAHLQAAHNQRMAAAAGPLVRTAALPIVLGDDYGPAAPLRLAEIFRDREAKPALWRWLCVRMDGPPSTMVIRFRRSDAMYQRALQDIDDAVAIHASYVEKCGADQIWFTSHGEVEIDDTDWPMGAWEGRS